MQREVADRYSWTGALSLRRRIWLCTRVVLLTDPPQLAPYLIAVAARGRLRLLRGDPKVRCQTRCESNHSPAWNASPAVVSWPTHATQTHWRSALMPRWSHTAHAHDEDAYPAPKRSHQGSAASRN
jgi:hypothetical protein